MAALAVCASSKACGDTVRVRKIAKPVFAGTEFAVKTDMPYGQNCFPFITNCVPRLTGGVPPPLTGARFKVGFQFDSYEESLNCCTGYWDQVNRGNIFFRTRDVPHHFTTATLVLKAESSNSSDPNAKVPFSGIYELAPGFGLNGDTEYDEAADQFTSSLDLGPQFEAIDATFLDFDPASYTTPFLVPFPPPPYPNGRVIEATGPFDFRIDVTANVNAWIKDWANRNQTPLHGFYLVGTDEHFPYSDNRALLVTYTATLEFDIDEPDL
jgi:hypothetical protein